MYIYSSFGAACKNLFLPCSCILQPLQLFSFELQIGATNKCLKISLSKVSIVFYHQNKLAYTGSVILCYLKQRNVCCWLLDLRWAASQADGPPFYTLGLDLNYLEVSTTKAISFLSVVYEPCILQKISYINLFRAKLQKLCVCVRARAHANVIW